MRASEGAVPPPAVAASGPSGQSAAAPTRPRRRRRGLIVAIVALLLLMAAVAVGLALTSSEQPNAGTGPTPAEPSASPTGQTSTDASPADPTPAELSQAVTDYYALLPDDTDAGWERLTGSYQRQTGGRDSYEDFWNDIDTVTTSDVSATAPDRVQATITYLAKSGNQRSTEQRSFRLVRDDGVLKIDQSSLI